jgi:hypothetical protein
MPSPASPEQEETVSPKMSKAQKRLTTPRAAAVAGILFSLLLLTSLVLVRIAVPANPQDAGVWLSGRWKTISLALNLVPFAGLAFLWFIGVLRDCPGKERSLLCHGVSGEWAPVSRHALRSSGGSGRHPKHLWH